jgi:tetratricopeptide (TPR) repeat protein
VLCEITLLAQREGFAELPLQQGVSFFFRLENALVASLLYVGKAIYPFYLGILYPFPTEIRPWAVAAAVVALAGATVFAVRRRHDYPYVFVGWLWYLGALVPMIGLVKVGRQQMADRYAYFPFIGLYVVIAWLTPVLIRSRTWRVSLATVAIAFYTVTGFIQVSYWRDGLTLMRHTLAVARDDWSLHLGLSEELTAAGRIDESLQELQRGVSVSPREPEAHWRLGRGLLHNHRYQAAEQAYRQALALDGNNIAALNGLGETLFLTGKYAEAKRRFSRALELEKTVPVTYVNLAYVSQRMGDYVESNRYCAIALSLDDDLQECRRLMQVNNQLLRQRSGMP